ncbi:MAG: hypothetical protein ABJE80_22900 [Reichenbachiella sp.]|uniref:hypothetical protein n=1 Tax=Reichenbachiella sp. TaxID=2184521 RepID=UPI0032630846
MLFSTKLVDEVWDHLSDLKIKSTELTNEKDVENIIADSLRSEFEDVQQQFHVGGYLGLKVDIDIKEEVGIELKLAKDLDTADKIHRLFGQAIYYDNRKYVGNLIVLIAGTKSERDSPMLKEVMNFLEDIKIPSLFLKTKGKA